MPYYATSSLSNYDKYYTYQTTSTSSSSSVTYTYNPATYTFSSSQWNYVMDQIKKRVNIEEDELINLLKDDD